MMVEDQLGHKSLSPFEMNKIREIIQALRGGNDAFLREKGIFVGNKSDYWVLNYQQGPRTDYNYLVRGMVVSHEDSLDPLNAIVSFPFVRFFNHGEKEAGFVNFANSHMIEKLDGTMVGVSHKDGDLFWHTRKMISLHESDMENKITTFHGKVYKFMPLIGQYVEKLRNLDLGYTYIFEFIHEASYVCSKYEPSKYGLYLIGVRNLRNYNELDEFELDEVADRIGAFRPVIWDSQDDMDYIVKRMKEYSALVPDFEGFVFRDKDTGKRKKLKDSGYVIKHRMLDKSRSTKTMLQLIFMDEAEEIIAYMPNTEKRIKEISEAYDIYLNKAVDRVLFWKRKGLSRKDLAVQLLGNSPIKGGRKSAPAEDPFVCAQTMRLYDIEQGSVYSSLDDAMKTEALNGPKGALKVIQRIGLVDVEQEDIGEI